MIFEAKLKPESGNRKIQYSSQAAILKAMDFNPYTPVIRCWSLDLIFEAKVKLVQKPKNPIWLPGDNFESDIVETP